MKDGWPEITNYEDMTHNGLYARNPSVGISGSDIKIGFDETYLFVVHFNFAYLHCSIDIATVFNHSKYWIGFNNDWREL